MYKTFFEDEDKLCDALVHSSALVAFFPFSYSKESRLAKRLYNHSELPKSEVMEDLIIAIRKGHLSLEPLSDSGWYDYQLYSLEPLVLPEKAHEKDKLLLHAKYKKRLRDAFESMIVKHRETFIKWYEPFRYGAASPPPIVKPALSLEPCASYYLRIARAYRFLKQKLTVIFSSQEIESISVEGLDQNFLDELDNAIVLFFGLYCAYNYIQWKPRDYVIPVQIFTEITRQGSKPLTRAEFRRICDGCDSKEEIIQALQSNHNKSLLFVMGAILALMIASFLLWRVCHTLFINTHKRYTSQYGEMSMYMTLCMDSILCVIFIYTGYLEARRMLARQPGITVENALEQAHYLFILIPVSLIPMCVSLLLKDRRRILWHMPLWLHYNLTNINWGIILSTVLFLFAIASGLALHTHHHKCWRIIGSLLIVVISIQISQFLSLRPIATQLTENLIDDGIILQTTGVTCCAASAANIARIFGIEKTEKEMAHLFGTTFQGTSAAQVVYGMRKLGFLCTMRDLHMPDPRLLRPPVMLFIDHPFTGPESHAVVYVGIVDERAEIWDPVMGKRFLSEHDLSTIWHCRGIEINIKSLNSDVINAI